MSGPLPPTTERHACRQEYASKVILEALRSGIEIRSNVEDLPFARTRFAWALRLIQGHQLEHRLVVLGNDDLLSQHGFLHQLGEVGLGVGDIEFGHGASVMQS